MSRPSEARLLARFWQRVNKTGGCWLWTGPQSGHGYGKLVRHNKQWYAHRYMWLVVLQKSIPEGFDLDHLCRNTLCVNPEHLEPVTHHENILRGESPMAALARRTHCPNGHLFEGSNVRLEGDGSRRCRTCRAIYRHQYREKYHK